MRAADLARYPGKDSPLGLRSWGREMRALASCMARPPCFPSGDLPKGGGHTVLVIPGFLTGDWTTARLREFLTRQGYRAEKAGTVFNAGPTARLTQLLERRLDALVQERGERITVMGQSLGGVFARGLAHRRPDAVARVVTLVTPIRFPVTTPLQPFVAAFSRWFDPAWVADAGLIAAAPSVPVTAIYSPEDGIVDWRQCLQEEGPASRNILVHGAHTTMASNPDVQAAVARALASSSA